MELKILEYFEEICRLKNFTKEAAKVHVAQHSITVSIKKLDVELLCRNQHSVTIINEGELFLKRVRQILYDMQNAVNEIEDFGSFYKNKIMQMQNINMISMRQMNNKRILLDVGVDGLLSVERLVLVFLWHDTYNR